MKVLHVIPSLSPVHGGPSVALPLMERALRLVGVEVETVTTDDDGPGRRNGRPLQTALSENGVMRRYFAKRTEFYKVAPSLARWVRREVKHYDVVHVHALFSYVSVAAARAARAAQVPYVIRPLGVLNRYGMTRRRALLKQLSFRWLEKPLLSEAAAVHFTSDSEREEAESLGVPMRSVVIPLGIEFSPNKEGDDKREPYILYLSRLDPKKNLEGLLKAWALLVPEFPEWKLLVAGEGELGYKQSLQDLTRKLGCAEQVEWLGHIEGEVKTLWLRKAQIFVLPSYSENFGIAAVEAMGAGLACVLGEGVAVGHAASRAEACLLTGTDVLQIKEQLKRVLGNSSLCTQLATKARVFARWEYGVETMAERLKQLYEGLIGQCRK